MRIIKETSFRELNRAYVFISLGDVSFLDQFFDNTAESNGILTYGFIDHENGICFEILCCGFYDSEKHGIKLYSSNDNVRITMSYDQLVDAEYMFLSENILCKETFKTKVDKIVDSHNVTETVEKARNITAIDGCRIEGCPDDVIVYLVKGNDYYETISVRLEDVGKMDLIGVMLEEPEKDFGVHCGDTIHFFIVKNEQGIMCMASF